MRRRTSHSQQTDEDLNIWQAFTDLMSSTFLIMSLFLLLVLVKGVFLQSTTNETNTKLIESQRKERDLQSEIGNLRTERNNLEAQAKNLELQLNQKAREAKELERKLKAAPVILIKDSDTDAQGRSLRFETGQADLPEGLKAFIDKDLVDKLERTAKEYPEYQIIDVIGHTDGQATIAQSNPSNLDTSLEAVAKGNNPINTLQAGSNTDLGLIRALAVVKKLQELQQSGRLKGLKFRAYSAGQLLMPDGNYADGSDRSANPSRRRIEIRFSPNPEPRSLR
jgi:flagellar motor protein MotB